MSQHPIGSEVSDAQDYVAIGRDLRDIARAAVAQWRRSSAGPTRQ